jgi:hypothetical protein
MSEMYPVGTHAAVPATLDETHDTEAPVSINATTGTPDRETGNENDALLMFNIWPIPGPAHASFLSTAADPGCRFLADCIHAVGRLYIHQVRLEGNFERYAHLRHTHSSADLPEMILCLCRHDCLRTGFFHLEIRLRWDTREPCVRIRGSESTDWQVPSALSLGPVVHSSNS